LLSLRIDSAGKVREVSVIDGAGYPALDQAACNAVKRWRFAPARRGDQAVEAVIELPVRFKLQ
jgi:protein TonB